MAQIEKIQNVMVDNKIDRVVMSIKDGEKVVEGEVYLAFVDTNTNKRYMIYTTEKAKSENDRIPFSLSTLVYENNSYVFHILNKFKLRPCTVKILVFKMGFKIYISV